MRTRPVGPTRWASGLVCRTRSALSALVALRPDIYTVGVRRKTSLPQVVVERKKKENGVTSIVILGEFLLVEIDLFVSISLFNCFISPKVSIIPVNMCRFN